MADIVYIGGGFGEGIHNTLEPAVWKKSLIFGPKYNRFPEAVEFVKMGCATSIETKEEFAGIVQKLESNIEHSQIESSFNLFFEKNTGASEKIYSHLLSKGLL